MITNVVNIPAKPGSLDHSIKTNVCRLLMSPGECNGILYYFYQNDRDINIGYALSLCLNAFLIALTFVSFHYVLQPVVMRVSASKDMDTGNAAGTGIAKRIRSWFSSRKSAPNVAAADDGDRKIEMKVV